jgi:hypothetical protein
VQHLLLIDIYHSTRSFDSLKVHSYFGFLVFKIVSNHYSRNSGLVESSAPGRVFPQVESGRVPDLGISGSSAQSANDFSSVGHTVTNNIGTISPVSRQEGH